MDSLTISIKLLEWYRSNQRNLPWRNTQNPYNIWISEVILQQTKISQGLDYYHNFINKFPTVNQLAQAPEDEILKIWQGLGYYSRARNLHSAAIYIHRELAGKFPDNFNDLKKLKGIGDYTAAAIASIAYNEPVASVDGNAYRVLARLFVVHESMHSASGKRIFMNLAEQLLDKEAPGDFNQAIMELGALICTPRSPNCSSCPLSGFCMAHKTNNILPFPAKATRAISRDRFFHYFVISNGETLLFKKRTGNDIWKNLYDFPLIESEMELNLEQIVMHSYWKELFGDTEPILVKYSNRYNHILTHQKIHARFIQINIKSANNYATDFVEINKNHIFELAIPRLIDKYVQKELT